MRAEPVEGGELVVGMEIDDANGVRVGRVLEVRPNELLIHRPVGDEALLPRTAVATVRDGHAILRVPGEELLGSGLIVPLAGDEPPLTEEMGEDAIPTAGEWEPAPAEPLPPPRWRDHVAEGMRVLTTDGADLGTVKEIEPARLLVDRPRSRDIWIPALYVDHAGGGAVILQLSEHEVETMAWEHPPLV